MGFRFRKSIKVMPGVRVNLSKSGVSTTIGARGASVTMGKRGVYSNVGIPGTGVSFRQRLDQSSQRRTRSQIPEKEVLLSEVSLELNDNGSIKYTDASTGVELGRSDINYLWGNYASVITDWLQSNIDEINNDEKISNIHYTISRPSATKPQFQPKEYEFEAPVEPLVPHVPPLSWFSKLFFKKKVAAREKKVYDLDMKYLLAMRKWTADMEGWTKDRDKFNEKQEDEKRQFNTLIRENRDYMEKHFEIILGQINWPKETLISYEISDDKTVLRLDVDLPEIEDLPIRVASLAVNGKKANIKNKSQKQQRLDYARHIHGIALKLASVSLSELPAIDKVIISGYSQRLDNATGNVNDDYLYGVEFTREGIEELNFEAPELIDPITAMENFSHNRKMTAAGAFNAVSPL